MGFTAIWVEVPLVRVYYNSSHAPSNKRWSVDFGPGSVEILGEKILITGCEVVTELSITGERERGTPAGWMEIQDAHVEVIGSHINITPITGPDPLEKIQVDWGE